MKLNKFISKYYSKSKKKAEKFILSHKVKVNNNVITDIFYDLNKYFFLSIRLFFHIGRISTHPFLDISLNNTYYFF